MLANYWEAIGQTLLWAAPFCWCAWPPSTITTCTIRTTGPRWKMTAWVIELLTVNRNALQSEPDILLRNERHINILKTQNFGLLGFIEVGALSVGRIVQVHPIDKPFKRGEQKSVFRFGGSAIVVFGEPGAWRPADDVLEKTSAGTETLLRLGEPVAKRER